MKKIIKTIILLSMLAVSIVMFTGCKDYCSYGGCTREAGSNGRCSEHSGLENDPYYGIPDSWK